MSIAEIHTIIALASLFLVGACADNGKRIQPAVIVSETQQNVSVANTELIEGSFNELSLQINNNLLTPREAGIIASTILDKNKTSNLSGFDYAKMNEVFSKFSKSLPARFAVESDKGLVFLAETLKINTLEGFYEKTQAEKEKIILTRIGALREQSYLEVEFFLANYFLNNKVFESLKAISANASDEDLTYCKGHLIKFVKDIYSKNARYPDAFSKYAIWGQVLNECNLAPIFISGIGQIKTSVPEIGAEQLILANILNSKEIRQYSGAGLRFDRKTPALVNSLINHTLYAAHALNNKNQIVFNLNSINNSLILLERVLLNATDADEISLLNLADNLWFTLYLNLRESLDDKASLFLPLIESLEQRKQLHPILAAIGIETTKKMMKSDLDAFLNSSPIKRNSAFVDKWELMKDSIVAQAYISALNIELTKESENIIHKLKSRLDKNIIEAAQFNQESLTSSGDDLLYQSLKDQLIDKTYVEAGKKLTVEELDLNRPVIINILANVTGDHDQYHLDFSHVRAGYFDFTPKSENIPLPLMVPFIHELPKYSVRNAGQIAVENSTEFECITWSEFPDICYEKPNLCRHWRRKCTSYQAFNYEVQTIMPKVPAQPQKIIKGMDGKKITVTFNESNKKSSILVIANGEDGFKGVKGTDSPLCLNGHYAPFAQTKNGTVIVTTKAQQEPNSLYSRITNTIKNVDAGTSGDGGDGGAGGKIIVKGDKKAAILLALGGQGGLPGERASCAPDGHFIGVQGTDGSRGVIEETINGN